MKLILQFNDKVSNPDTVLKEGEYIIGRSPECKIIINKNTISRKHCKIYYKNGKWFIKDLNSTNGTYYQGLKLNNESVEIKDGSLILVHDIPIIVRFSKKGTPQKKFPIEIIIENNETDDIRIFDEIEEIIEKFFVNKDVRNVAEYLNVVTNKTNIDSIGIIMFKEGKSELLFTTGYIETEVLRIIEPLILKGIFNYKYGRRTFLIRKLFYSNYPVFSYFLINSNNFTHTYLINKINLILKLLYLFMQNNGVFISGETLFSDEPGVDKKDLVVFSDAMKEVLIKASKFSLSNKHILIVGENGTGKELIARFIRKNSRRKDKPFETINLAYRETGIIDNELFGHRKGAFTGAVESHKGIFERNNGGIVFLDEISLLPMSLQGKLLRTVEYGEILPVGDKTKKVDVQIIFATNEDLKKLVKEGSFRQDLYYRISTLEIKIPPLRERKEEIIPLFKYFLRKNIKNNINSEIEISKEVEDLLLKYSWPGNVRQLENVAVYISVVLDKRKRKIEIRDLPLNLLDDFHELLSITKAKKEEPSFNVNKKIEEVERELIKKAMISASGNKSKAAKLLGISRVTLINKLKKYGLKKIP